MLGKEACFRPQVDGYRDGDGENGDEGDGQRETEKPGPPVEAVEVEDLGDPDQGRYVVEAVVNEEEEPEVELDLCFSVTRDLVAVSVSEVRLLVARERILWKR